MKSYTSEFYNDSDIVPPWVGQFWNEENARWSIEKVPFPSSVTDHAYLKTIMVSSIRSLPTQETIAKVVAFRPDAVGLMEAWKSVWDRSFPGWESAPLWSDIPSEVSTREYAKIAIDRIIKNEVEMATSISRLVPFGRVPFLLNIESAMSRLVDDHRDYRLHIIDDANTVVSCCENRAYGTVLNIGGHRVRLAGHFSDGLPRFEFFEDTLAFARARLDDHPEYWLWREFQRHLKRRTIISNDVFCIGAVFADMAWQGYSHAFVKSCLVKGGTWTIKLSGIKTIMDGVKKAREAFFIRKRKVNEKEAYLIQEHIPFTHEQRFFVVDGRIIASVCSDRNFCVLDKRKNRILDDRVAVLSIPSIDDGEFDRGKTSYVVDRALSAKMARFARNVVADLRETGRDDYRDFVLDVGLTSRGIAAIEVNPLLAGPYCLDKALVNRAYKRRYIKFYKELEAQLIKLVKEACLSVDVRKKINELQNEGAVEIFLNSPIDPSAPICLEVEEIAKQLFQFLCSVSVIKRI